MAYQQTCALRDHALMLLLCAVTVKAFLNALQDAERHILLLQCAR